LPPEAWTWHRRCARHASAIDIVEADRKPTAACSKALPTGATATRAGGADGADGLFIDVTGCTHLFGGERAMLDDILSRFFHQGFDVAPVLPRTGAMPARFAAAIVV